MQKLALKYSVGHEQTLNHDGRLPLEAAAGVICSGCIVVMERAFRRGFKSSKGTQKLLSVVG